MNRITKFALIAAIAAPIFSGCSMPVQADAPEKSTDSTKHWVDVKVSSDNGVLIQKACDGPNLIYMAVTSRSISVVPNAYECKVGS